MAAREMEIMIDADGELQAIYDDALVELFAADEMTVRRASHVEPCVGGWCADLSPVAGPVLGPFRRRQEALDAEVAWLRAEMARRRL